MNMVVKNIEIESNKNKVRIFTQPFESEDVIKNKIEQSSHKPTSFLYI